MSVRGIPEQDNPENHNDADFDTEPKTEAPKPKAPAKPKEPTDAAKGAGE